MKTFSLILVLLFAANVSAAEPPRVQTELITLAMDESVNDLFLFDGEKPVRFRAASGGIGMPVPYKGPAQLILHHTAEAFLPADEETAVPPPAAVVNLPADADRVLLITFRKEGVPLRIQAIPVPLNDTGAGDYRFMNFSNRQAVIVLNGQTVPLPSGQSKSVPGPSSPSRSARQDVEIKIGSQTADGPKIYSSVWGHQSNRRYFVFLLNGSTPGAPLRIQRFHDRVPE